MLLVISFIVIYSPVDVIYTAQSDFSIHYFNEKSKIRLSGAIHSVCLSASTKNPFPPRSINKSKAEITPFFHSRYCFIFPLQTQRKQNSGYISKNTGCIHTAAGAGKNSFQSFRKSRYKTIIPFLSALLLCGPV